MPRDLLSVSRSDKLWDTHVKQYEMKPSLDLKPPATSAHRRRLFCIQLVSSPDLHRPINLEPYGFQLWLLADVCPTHHSIWFTGGFAVTFWEFWRILPDFDYQSSSGGLVFSQRWHYGPVWLLFMHESLLRHLQCQHSLLGVSVYVRL